MEELIHLDQTIFLAINRDLGNPVFDVILPLFRNKYLWIPLYIALAIWIAFQYRNTWKTIAVIGVLALTVLFSDQFSAGLIKPMVKRDRPCNDMEFRSQVTLRLDSCGGGYSFVSAHAANHFALAMCILILMKNRKRWVAFAWMIWAFLIAFSQVYVGVHYPLDIIVGALIGIGVGFLTGRFGLVVTRQIDELQRK